jgi:mono/diheme cytochrome c family protein
VRSVLSSTRIVRVLALALPCLSPLLSGCSSDTYPADLVYPLRGDPIVVKAPSVTPWDTTGPGQQDIHIATFKDDEILQPKNLEAKDRQQLDTVLGKIFGTPANPTVEPEDSEARTQRDELKLDKDALKEGSEYYRLHCMHCHGVAGDGRGPTGPWINPHPRDYRQGRFKFLSSDPSVVGRKPRRADLRHTLEHGIEGTSMPSFSLLSEKDKEELVSYIIHLSLRGEVEMNLMKAILNKEPIEGTLAEYAQDTLLKTFLASWSQSNAKVLEPDPYPYKADDEEQRKKLLAESISRGYNLFTDTKSAASCIACHVDFGRQVPFRYDEWGTLVRPANLTDGVYRGGRRPLDLYWRVRGGIDPSGMPRANLQIDKDRKTDEYWDVVNFVQALPYPQMLPEEIRYRIYPRHDRGKSSAHAAR